MEVLQVYTEPWLSLELKGTVCSSGSELLAVCVLCPGGTCLSCAQHEEVLAVSDCLGWNPKLRLLASVCTLLLGSTEPEQFSVHS